jgi:hypothetical protein
MNIDIEDRHRTWQDTCLDNIMKLAYLKVPIVETYIIQIISFSYKWQFESVSALL